MTPPFILWKHFLAAQGNPWSTTLGPRFVEPGQVNTATGKVELGSSFALGNYWPSITAGRVQTPEADTLCTGTKPSSIENCSHSDFFLHIYNGLGQQSFHWLLNRGSGLNFKKHNQITCTVPSCKEISVD